MARKVVDSGASQHPRVKDFLASSVNNQAVLTEFWALETFRRRGDYVHRSFAVLGPHAKQVIVLKLDRAICQLRPRLQGLPRRHISERESNEFERYFAAMAKGTRGIDENLEGKAKASEEYMAVLSGSTPAVQKIMVKFIESNSGDDLAAMRSPEKRLTSSAVDRLNAFLIHLTKTLYATSSPQSLLPSAQEVRYSYQFRFALAVCSLTLHWARVGTVATLPVAKLQNDISDATYAAHATFFDGLFTRDKKLADVFNLSLFLLQKLYNVPTHHIDRAEALPSIPAESII